MTIDHQVSHTSTLPANAGQAVRLFLRERVRSSGPAGKVVLLVQGRDIPALAAFDLQADRYSWAGTLARAGLDVFVLDVQGLGRSPLPDRDVRLDDGTQILSDPCNVPTAEQHLVPQIPSCAPSYPFQLATARSDWDELDTAVEYIRALRQVDKVFLVGFSLGAVRVGPYTVQHPEKIESLLFLAPFYDPSLPAARPGTGEDGFGPPINPRTGAPFTFPQPGTPMRLTTRAALMSSWNREVVCEKQVEDGIQDVAWSAIMENDAVGRTWGLPNGLLRGRTTFLWSWNPTTVARIPVPVLIIGGESDQSVPPTMSRLYDELTGVPNAHKMLFKVQCAGHSMLWERQRRALYNVSKQWFKDGAVDGYTTGRFFIDSEGTIHRQ